jgi:hypothetical protein
MLMESWVLVKGSHGVYTIAGPRCWRIPFRYKWLSFILYAPARISGPMSAAAADAGMSGVLPTAGFVAVVSKPPEESSW